jgi:hypothetical protein
MKLPENVFERDKVFNTIAKDLFRIDFENTEFHFVMLSSLISLLMKKGIFTEEEFSAETEEVGAAFKLMKHRNKLQEKVDNPES